MTNEKHEQRLRRKLKEARDALWYAADRFEAEHSDLGNEVDCRFAANDITNFLESPESEQSVQDGWPIEDAVSKVCANLPEGYEVLLCMEKDFFGVQLYNRQGDRGLFSEPTNKTLVDQLNEAVRLANKEESQ